MVSIESPCDVNISRTEETNKCVGGRQVVFYCESPCHGVCGFTTARNFFYKPFFYQGSFSKLHAYAKIQKQLGAKHRNKLQVFQVFAYFD